jgi:hypothetical protein
MGKKSRLWCFTNFNLDFDYEKYFNTSSASYLIYGLEICPKTKKSHHQGAVYFSGARGSVKQVAKELGKCNVRMCNGTLDQNIDYCVKDNNVVELGIKPNQGERKDLDTLKNAILEQKLTVDEITCNTPHLFHKYGRTLNKLEDIALRMQFRKKMTEGIWYYGPTGTGKSHTAFVGYSPETHYILPLNDKGWWDGYTGQKTVICNEFRGEIVYSELLDLLDKWPKNVPRRGREPVPLLAEKILITSDKHPNLIYSECDSLEQLFRRCKIVKMEQKYSGGNTEPQSS